MLLKYIGKYKEKLLKHQKYNFSYKILYRQLFRTFDVMEAHMIIPAHQTTFLTHQQVRQSPNNEEIPEFTKCTNQVFHEKFH